MKNVLFFVLFISLIGINSSIGQVNNKDSLALVDFYKSTNGNDWKNKTNWLTSAPISTWFGLGGGIVNGRITSILLYENNLSGIIPTSIGNLTGLQTLDIHGNKIGGKIPDVLGNLKQLDHLDLSENQLGGSIPNSIGNLNKLFYLILNTNHLTGSVPSSIGNLINLRRLWLRNNQLSGSIPTSFSKLTNLLYLHLENNLFSGEYPAFLNKLKLKGLDLSDNKFTNPPTAP